MRDEITQLPPWQVPCEYWFVLALQLSPRQTVPVGYVWHPPCPLQRPLVPHDPAPLSTQIRSASVTPRATRGSGVLAGTFVQRPRALGNAQNWHLPVQAVLQQTPSAQKPLRHSAPFEHVWPGPFFPQLPPWHVLGATHSELLPQDPRQAASAQVYGAQLIGEPVMHVPAPSQMLAGINVAPEQAAALQIVPAAYLLHPPCPLQTPLWPHVSGPCRVQT